MFTCTSVASFIESSRVERTPVVPEGEALMRFVSRVVFPEPKVFGESLFLPVVQVKGVFQQQNSLCELVCLQAIRFLSQRGNTKWRNHKEAKVGLDVSQRGH